MTNNMGLPDLFQATELLRELVIAGVAQAADQPAAIPPAPLPVMTEDMKGILTNLGGWGLLLWSIVKSISGRVERFGKEVTGKLDRLTVQVKRLAREMSRIRHSPPPAAYSDGEIPVHKPKEST